MVKRTTHNGFIIGSNPIKPMIGGYSLIGRAHTLQVCRYWFNSGYLQVKRLYLNWKSTELRIRVMKVQIFLSVNMIKR